MAVLTEEPPAAPLEPDRPSRTHAPDAGPARALRWFVAAASLGAAVLHFGHAPSHFDQYWVYGAFLVAVAWLQVASAVALLSRPSPRRAPGHDRARRGRRRGVGAVAHRRRRIGSRREHGPVRRLPRRARDRARGADRRRMRGVARPPSLPRPAAARVVARTRRRRAGGRARRRIRGVRADAALHRLVGRRGERLAVGARDATGRQGVVTEECQRSDGHHTVREGRPAGVGRPDPRLQGPLPPRAVLPRSRSTSRRASRSRRSRCKPARSSAKYPTVATAVAAGYRRVDRVRAVHRRALHERRARPVSFDPSAPAELLYDGTQPELAHRRPELPRVHQPAHAARRASRARTTGGTSTPSTAGSASTGAGS